MTNANQPSRRARRHHDRRQGRRRIVVVGAALVTVLALGTVGALAVTGDDSPPATPAGSPATTMPVSTGPHTTTTTGPKVTPVSIPVGGVAPVLSRIPTADRVVFFTIDDGLVRDPNVLTYLQEQKIPVTMFLLPAYFTADPAYFQTIQRNGATAQDHTVTHRDLTKLTAGQQVQEICGPIDGLTRTFGSRPWLFRPPGGAWNPTTQSAVRQCGLQAIITWRATMNDGRLALQSGAQLQPGDIILFHFRPDLRKNLEVALNAARAAGLTPARLEDYLPQP